MVLSSLLHGKHLEYSPIPLYQLVLSPLGISILTGKATVGQKTRSSATPAPIIHPARYATAAHSIILVEAPCNPDLRVADVMIINPSILGPR